MHLPRPLLPTTLAALMLVASPASHAGLAISYLDPLQGGVLHSIPSDPLARWQHLIGTGQVAAARFTEQRRTRLVDFALNQPVVENLFSDSGWVSTAVAGQPVGAFASVVLTPQPAVNPARARAAPFENHVRASTQRKVQMENDVPVTLDGVEYGIEDLYVYNHNNAYATSGWFDTWTAQAQASATLTLRLDGKFDQSSCLGDQTCLVASPPGITSVYYSAPHMSFSASFTVLDLDTLVTCDDLDLCDDFDGQPMAVAMAQARYVRDGAAAFPQLVDESLNLSFQVQAGHRYLAIGVMEAAAGGGGSIDFYNSFRITSLEVPAGALLSTALGGSDLAGHFAQPVPEPASVVMWALGLIAVGAQMRRRHTRA